MSAPPFDWSDIRLVVFDVDGTLYDQSALRLSMLAELSWHALKTRSSRTVRILKRYRTLRETIGEAEQEGFDDILLARTAEDWGLDVTEVGRIVQDWMERRPLRHLRRCRYAHVDRVFAELRRRKIAIGIFSDYPATDKLRVLGLDANVTVCAGDASVKILKPHPRGLYAVMAAVGVGPDQTLMVGDRIERDGEVARRAGTQALIRSPKPQPDWHCFRSYADPPFSTLFSAA